MRSLLLRARARLSGLLVTISVGAPAAPVVLSGRAGAASTETATRTAMVGVGGLAVGLRACAGSAEDVARAGMAGTRAAGHGVSWSSCT